MDWVQIGSTTLENCLEVLSEDRQNAGSSSPLLDIHSPEFMPRSTTDIYQNIQGSIGHNNQEWDTAYMPIDNKMHK